MTETEAIEIAEQIAQENDWIWVMPVEAMWRPHWFGAGGRWEIYSNADRLGAKVRVVIDSQSGNILEKGYISR